MTQIFVKLKGSSSFVQGEPLPPSSGCNRSLPLSHLGFDLRTSCVKMSIEIVES